MPKSKDPLNQIIEEVNRKHKGALSRGDSLGQIRGFIPTGSTLLDLLLKGGGIPMGRLTEIYGTHSIGKTTFMASLIRECQNMGGYAMVLDTETSMDQVTIERVGAKYNDIAWQTSLILEDGFTVLRSFIDGYEDVTRGVKKKPPCLIIWDTIAASPSKLESEDGAGMADKARVLSLELRRITQRVAESGVALIFVNQMRDAIGGYGSQEMVPGGRAIKFHASLRLKIKRAKQFQVEGGQNITFTVDKLKYGRPREQVTVFLNHDTGIDEYTSLLGYLLEKEDVNGVGPGEFDAGKSGVWMAGGWLKIDLPETGRNLSLRTKQLSEYLDTDDPGDELKKFLKERTKNLWQKAG